MKNEKKTKMQKKHKIKSTVNNLDNDSEYSSFSVEANALSKSWNSSI